MSKYKVKDYISQEWAKQILDDLGPYSDMLGQTKTLLEAVADGAAKFHIFGDKTNSGIVNGKQTYILNEIPYSPERLVQELKHNENSVERAYVMMLPVKAISKKDVNQDHHSEENMMSGDAASVQEITRQIRYRLMTRPGAVRDKGVEIVEKLEMSMKLVEGHSSAFSNMILLTRQIISGKIPAHYSGWGIK